MPSTKMDGQLGMSYEMKTRETLELAKRIYALAGNLEPRDISPAQVKDLSTLILSLMDLNDEGYVSLSYTVTKQLLFPCLT
jgi:hypothetical protein